MPRVSAILPTHNRRPLLARALNSIDSQSFRDFEVLVIDDGSVDGTADWLRAIRPDVRLVEMGQARGAAAARNQGVERARGEIVAFLDDDDVWRPSYLDVQVATLDAHPEADLSTTGHVEVDHSGRIAYPDLRPLYSYSSPIVRLLAECPVHTLSVVACRRTVFERIGPFDEALSIVHDLDWYLRLLASGGKMQHSPSALVERSVPGGLVTRHRTWFEEERSVHRRLLETLPTPRADRRSIRAARALLFARLGVERGDFSFAFARLAEAFLVSPLGAARTTLLRTMRHLNRGARAHDRRTLPAL